MYESLNQVRLDVNKNHSVLWLVGKLIRCGCAYVMVQKTGYNRLWLLQVERPLLSMPNQCGFIKDMSFTS